jgi:hypothetical protein
MWGKLKTRVVAADAMSVAAVRQVFNMNTLEAQFRRATAGSVTVTISSGVGNLISSLYAHVISTVSRTDILPPFLNYQISELVAKG